MEIFGDIDIKSVIIGAAIATGLVIIGSWGYDFAYPFSAIGLLYVGYKAKTVKMGTILGAFAATPLVILGLDGRFGVVTGDMMKIALIILILLVGAFIGFVGAKAKSDREKAKIEYEKKQKIGKNKNKKKNNN